MQHGSAAVQAAFSVELARPKLIRSMNLDLGKLAFNALASGRFDGGADGNSQTIGNVNDDVADRSLQPRIGERNTSPRQRRNNPPASRLAVNPARHPSSLHP